MHNQYLTNRDVILIPSISPAEYSSAITVDNQSATVADNIGSILLDIDNCVNKMS